jgi:aminoglycoside phosphotransferase
MSEPLDLDAIEARHKASTPGEWVEDVTCVGSIDNGYICGLESMNESDMKFIAHAHQDIPALLAEVRRAHKEIALDDNLLDRYKSVIALIPECSDHGDQCLPNAENWIRANR